MTGLYELFFSILGGDAQLQSLLEGTASDKKVYPDASLARQTAPAVGMSLWSDRSDIGFPVQRPSLDLEIVSKVSRTQVVSIDARIEALLNRKRLAGNGRIVHLAVLQFARDDFNEEAREFVRNVRYALVAQ